MHTGEQYLLSHRRGNYHSPLNTIFSLTESNLVEVEDQLSTRVMNMLPEHFGRRFEEQSRNLESHIFLAITFRLDTFVTMTDLRNNQSILA
jgi:hypothetical protein